MSPALRRALLSCLALCGAAGAQSKHWSFEPLRRVAAASGAPAQLARTLDRLLDARRRAAGLTRSKPADPRTLVRRLFLDVTGLPPTPETIDRFAANPSDAAWAALVDHVLASPRYGERWAQHWLDVVRYADTHGFEVNTPRTNAWPYRDWVIRALNDDLPYDAFVRAQIAGDQTGTPVATGFLVAGPANLPGQIGKDLASKRQARQDELDEIIKATGSAFLGLTVGCARCHDHKFDPVTQKDYYAMQAVFSGVRYGERRLLDPDKQKRAKRLEPTLASVRTRLRAFEPVARGTIVLDETTPMLHGRGVRNLRPQAGRGTNPKGRRQGYRDSDTNFSGGGYAWWRDAAGRDLMLYAPGHAGRYEVRLSWGRGFATHTTAAQYLLDRDGDPRTRDDQTPIATINQRHAANQTAKLPNQPLWSGLRPIGAVDFGPRSAILLRGGPGQATTADVLLLTPEDEPLALRSAITSKRNVERFEPRRARYVRFTAHAVNSKYEPCLDELEVFAKGSDRNLARTGKATSSGDYIGNARHKLEHIHDGRYGNGRSWISNTVGKGWVQIELDGVHEIDRIEWGRDRDGRYQDRTPTRYTIEVAERPGAWQVVATDADRIPPGSAPSSIYVQNVQALLLARHLAELEHEYAELRSGPRVFAGTFHKPTRTRRLHRGNPALPREDVLPDAPTALGRLRLAANAGDAQRRTALAEWLTEPQNPLTPRVAVNRIWQHHFGTGLVDTPSDFGKNGGRPSHPELLDWLASVLIHGAWSTKHVHRVILLSAAYRQSNAANAKALDIDRDNRLLWRFASRRLEAETIRDSMLRVSGALDLAMGGPGFSLFVPNTNYVRVYEPKTKWGADTFRRMIYAHKVRMEPDGVFGAFDCPDAGQAAPKRSRSTTALQSLNLFNSSFVLQQADRFAKRAARGKEPICTAFRLALGRAPTAKEHRDATALVDRHGLRALCRVLLNTNEFLVLP